MKKFFIKIYNAMWSLMKKIITYITTRTVCVEVNNYSELLVAIKDGEKNISLNKDIICDDTINIPHDVIINGYGHSIYSYSERVGFAYDDSTETTDFHIALSRVEHEDGTEVPSTEKYPDNVGTYRIKVDNDVELIKNKTNYINFSCGWTAYTFPVLYIKDDYLYFKSQGAEYSLDYDYYQGNHKKYVEYRLVGCNTDNAYKRYIINVIDGTLTLNNCIISGGIKGGNINMNSCTVKNCSEYGIYSVGNVNVYYSKFMNIWKSAVYVKGASLTVESCTLSNVNQGRTNYGAIDVDGNANISHNTLSDYGSYGIRVGKVKALSENECPTISVDNNKLEYTKNNGTVTDTGAIYVAANNKHCLINANNILDYTGRKNNHAIYCDDGSYNVDVINNLVTNCPNGYAISCRCADPGKPSSSTYRGYGGGKPNTNRTIANNILESGVWFGGSTDVEDNGCHYYGNIVEDNTGYKSCIENVKYS